MKVLLILLDGLRPDAPEGIPEMEAAGDEYTVIVTADHGGHDQCMAPIWLPLSPK